MTQRYFDEVAEKWDEMRGQFFSERVRDAALRATAVETGMRALDVGAGSGFITEALLSAGARVTAIDASAGMASLLAGRYPDVEARRGDAEALPFDDATFDRAYANMCLHHVERPAAAIREMARVLAPGGRMAITDLDAHSFEFLMTEHHDRWPGFSRQEIARWMAEAGLVEVRVEGAGESCCATSACGTEAAKVGIFLATGAKPG